MAWAVDAETISREVGADKAEAVTAPEAVEERVTAWKVSEAVEIGSMNPVPRDAAIGWTTVKTGWKIAGNG